MAVRHHRVKRVRRILHLLRLDTGGATAVEYGLIVALIVLVMIAALNGVASNTIAMWNNVSESVVTAGRP